MSKIALKFNELFEWKRWDEKISLFFQMLGEFLCFSNREKKV